MIQEYIKNQLEDDYAKDQISLKEYMDPYGWQEKVGQKKTATLSGCL